MQTRTRKHGHDAVPTGSIADAIGQSNPRREKKQTLLAWPASMAQVGGGVKAIGTRTHLRRCWR